MNRDQLAARLLATFVGELGDQVHELNTELLALEKEPANAEHVRAVFRIFHTLKGAARAASVPVLEALCHELESLLARARAGTMQLGAAEISTLFSAADALTDAAQRLGTGENLAASSAQALLDRVRGAPAGAQPPAEGGPQPPATQTTARPLEHARVELEKLDALLMSTGELITANQQIEALRRELRALHESAAGWHREAERRGQNDGAENRRQLVSQTRQLSRSADQHAASLQRVTDTITERARQLRMRPMAEIMEPLPRVVRDLSESSGKKITLRLRGETVQADRDVLGYLSDALLQLVRNAVDHGIESPAQRVAARKSIEGQLEISAELLGNRVRLSVRDDGAGLDIAALRAEVERRGHAAPADLRELLRVITQLNVSTRTMAGAISGRGVGLDIVFAALAQLQGNVDIVTERGQGTTFVLECPTSLATLQAVLVKVAGQPFALPATRVLRVIHVSPADVHRAEGRAVILFEGTPIPVVSLARALGPPLRERGFESREAAAVLSANGRQLAAIVDEIMGEQEIVVRPLTGSGVPATVSGAIQLGTGELALLLNADTVVERGLGERTVLKEGGASAPAAQPQRRRILVVDDSITTRALEQSVLEAAGYEVLTAVDGADAWRRLQEEGCDLVVTDIEMPNLDGFELCKRIRASRHFEDLPVVLVSALEAPEHRARGVDVGADAYLGKSSFDQERLLTIVQQLIGDPA